MNQIMNTKRLDMREDRMENAVWHTGEKSDLSIQEKLPGRVI